MNKAIRQLGVAAFLGAAAWLGPAVFAQDAVTQTTTTTSANGTITEFSPGTDVVIRSETSPDPVRYTYTKSTTVVDQTGAPVDVSVVKTGVPVHVFYDREGDEMIARKIVVDRTPTEPTTVVPAQPLTEPSTVIQKQTTTTTTTQDH